MTHSFGWIHPRKYGKKHVGKRTGPAAGAAWTCPSIDLSPSFPEIWDQSNIGSCTAQATGSCVSYNCVRSGWPMETPSRLDIYYRAREAIGMQQWDSGAMISDCLAALSTSGWIEERDWPYSEDRLAVHPPDSIRGPADHRRMVDYEALDWDATSIQWELNCGNAVVFGCALYESFRNIGDDGIVPEPGGLEIGGHAMVVVGYDPVTGRYKVRNSWGMNFGLFGHCFFSGGYITDPFEVGEIFAVRSVRIRP